jgi:thioesterase domain-containing protein
MKKVQPNGPYNLIGYSFGGYIAYEMARRLEQLGEQVNLLGMLDVGAVIEARAVADLKDSAVFLKILYGDTFEFDVDTLRDMPEDQQYLHIAELARNAGEQVTESMIEDVKRQVNVCIAFERSLVGYEQSPYRGHVTLIRASLDREFSVDDDPSVKRWLELTGNNTTVHNVMLSHDHLLDEVNASLISGCLMSRLSQV